MKNNQNLIKGTASKQPENVYSPKNLPTVFNKNLNNNSKLKPFNEIVSDVGDIQYFPAWSKEWRNSVYHYNSNLIKNFPVYDINLVKIIKLYFNTYFNHQFLNYKHMLNRKRRLSFNKIFFARPEIKHTNSKAIITLYTYNREKIALLKKIVSFQFLTWRLWCFLSSAGEAGFIHTQLVRRKSGGLWNRLIISWNRDKSTKGKKLVWGKRKKFVTYFGYLAIHLFKTFKVKLPNLLKKKNKRGNIMKWVWGKKKRWVTCLSAPLGILKKMEKFFFRSNMLFAIMKDKNLLQDFYAFLSVLMTSEIKAKQQANKWVKTLFRKEFKLLRKYKFKLNLNKYKFEEKFLSRLSNIISKIYNKKIEFNIVNLKNIVFNTDLFTEISTKKIQKRNNRRVTKIMHIMLNKANIPRVNRIQERGKTIKSVNLGLLENKYRTLNLKDILKGQPKLDKFFKKIYTSVNSVSYGLASSFLPQVQTKLYNLVFNSIRYKNLHGIRMEVKGRLTPRYRADRSIYKVRWKGGLKNIYSSYQGVSVRKNRGHLNPNVSYSIFSSKRRVGAFAVKGWTGAKS